MNVSFPKRNQLALNYTSVNFTFNSNVKITTELAAEEFETDMFKLFEDLVKDEKDMEEIFGSPKVVNSVKFESFGVEVGEKMFRGHIHASITILHKVPQYSVGKLNRRFKEWLGNNYGGVNEWYVYSKITASGAYANYSNKLARAKANREIVEVEDLQEEIARLSL